MHEICKAFQVSIHTILPCVKILLGMVPSIDVQHFLVKYLLFKSLSLINFKFQISKFQHMKNNYAKYTFCCVFVIITQWLGQ
jgi:hypothetical protein